MTPPIQVLGPGVVLLTGPAVAAAHTAVAIARRNRQRNGHPESRALLELQHALEIASAAGQSDDSKSTESDTRPIEWISTEQVAEQLRCSTRNVRRIATRLGGQMINGRYQFDAQTITEHIEGLNH